MMTDDDFRRGQDRAFDVMWATLDGAEGLLKDDDGRLDPYARAVMAVIRGHLNAMVEEVANEWTCEDRIQRAREAR